MTQEITLKTRKKIFFQPLMVALIIKLKALIPLIKPSNSFFKKEIIAFVFP